MKKFEDMNVAIRYLGYLGISFIIEFGLNSVVNPYGDINYGLNSSLVIAILTTLFCVMDMAWHRAGEDMENAKENKNSIFLIGQFVRLFAGFFIFLITLSLANLVYNLIK